MCENKTNCSCGCSTKKQSLTEAKDSIKKRLKEAPQKKQTIELSVSDREGELKDLLHAIKDISNSGHSFEVWVDPKKDNDINSNHKDGPRFYIDGDGSDKIFDIKISENTIDESINLSDKQQLFEKIDLKLSSNTKRELVKHVKAALDAMYNVYNIAEKQNITKDEFLDLVDGSFEDINELLTLLVTQNSIETK
jgi:hypothetical protein